MVVKTEHDAPTLVQHQPEILIAMQGADQAYDICHQRDVQINGTIRLIIPS
jgi:hypothetical protein